MHFRKLTVGNLVRRGDGSYGIVEVVLIINEPQVMYNLSVSHVATYLVGEGRWVVHNDDIIIFRFADRMRPETLQPALSRSSGLTRLMGTFMHTVNPRVLQGKYRDWLATMHSQGSLSRNDLRSPFVSATTDINSALGTGDPTLAKIMTGYEDAAYPRPGVERAPDIATLVVPESRLVIPDTNAAITEREILFYGEDLRDFLNGWEPNLYGPENLTNPRFCGK